MGTAIFEDLGIDHSDMLSNPVAFAERVYATAEELRTILRADLSVNSLIEDYKDLAKPAPEQIKAELELIYTTADTVSLEHMEDIIKQVKKLAADLETAFRDRAIREAADKGKSIADKKTVHAQYTRLRDDFNLIAKSYKVLMAGSGIDLKLLPPMPGNYGAQNSTLVNYVFEYKGEQYRNHHIICRKLGLETMPLMDLLEYIENNQTDVIVKEVH